ncbi:MAG: PQQ-binding-like beta-propeller repeat protein [Gemmatimonadetes bacterium]|nr:PQQ-binding-like beta-propeller repeat protein [Gemmatimonadota bacterium]
MPREVVFSAVVLSALAVFGWSMPGGHVAAAGQQSGTETASSGEAVYRAQCTLCHARALFENMPARRILRALESGIMAPFAAGLGRAEREAVSDYLGTPDSESGPSPEAFCGDRTVAVNAASAPAWNGWSQTAGNMRYQPAEAAGVSVQQVRDLKLQWAFGFDRDLASYSQPAVIDGQVFVGSDGGVVYALQAETGCIQWTFAARAPIRTAILVAARDSGHAVLFGDQTAWFYALDAKTGQLLWSREVDDHPTARITGSPVTYEGVVFVPVASLEEQLSMKRDYDQCCTFRGSVAALRVEDGTVIWKSYLIAETARRIGTAKDGRSIWGPSGAGVWSAPTVDPRRGVVYVTTGNNYSPPATPMSDAVVALNMTTGAVVWTRQITADDVFSGCGTCVDERGRGPDHDFAASAILVSRDGGRDILLAGQKSGIVYGFDPDRQGEIVWQTRIAQGSSHGGVQWGIASDGEYVYAPIADGGFTRIEDADGFRRAMLEPNGGGGLAALRVTDGALVWRAEPAAACAGIDACSPAQLGAATAIPGVVFSGAMDGHIRAYSAENGVVIWDFDTLGEHVTVNGVAAKGGALNGNGPVVVNGMVFVNSGYNHFNSITGNVLLMFRPEAEGGR